MTGHGSLPKRPHAGVRITVAGSARASFPPERCTVHLRVAHDGPARQAVQEATARQLADVQERVAALYDPARGPVNWWSAEQLYTSQHRPYNNAGEQLPFVYSAAATVAVRFADLSRVSEFVSAVAELPGVSIAQLNWTLTRAVREREAVSIRAAAVRDAIAKAQAYAQSLDLSTVTAMELSEPGLRQSSAPQARMYAAVAGSAPQAELELRPQDIAVEAAVEAVFIADGPGVAD